MAGDNRIELLEFLRKAGHEGDIDFLAEAVRMMAQVLMELDVRRQVGAAAYERSPARQTYRNGYRARLWDTRVGRIELRIPKLRQGSDFSAILEPRRRAEQALVAVIQEAYVHGVSTRKVDELVQALVVANGVKDSGEREVLGLDVGPSEDGAFWMAFLRGLVARGLKGVKLMISDAHVQHDSLAKRERRPHDLPHEPLRLQGWVAGDGLLPRRRNFAA